MTSLNPDILLVVSVHFQIPMRQKKNIPSSKALQPEHDQANQLMLVFFTVFKEKQFPAETYTDPCQISTAKSR